MRNSEIARILHAVQQTPWAIQESKLAEIRALLIARVNGHEISAEDREALIRKAEDRQRYQQQGSVAVIPVFGTIAQRMNGLMAMSGGTSTELLDKQIQTAVVDPDISAIVLNIDSPGGNVSGVPEIHTSILAARDQKPIVASVNPLAASAAYWIASATSEIVSVPSGEAGSIGVFSMHVDESAALEQEGFKVSLIHAGKYKVEGNPFEPLTEEARASIQADVDAFYGMFVRDIAKGRGISVADIKAHYGEGRTLLAKDAKAAGMIDRIETLPETISRLTKRPSSASRRAQDPTLDKMRAALKETI